MSDLNLGSAPLADVVSVASVVSAAEYSSFRMFAVWFGLCRYCVARDHDFCWRSLLSSFFELQIKKTLKKGEQSLCRNDWDPATPRRNNSFTSNEEDLHRSHPLSHGVCVCSVERRATGCVQRLQDSFAKRHSLSLPPLEKRYRRSSNHKRCRLGIGGLLS